MPTSPRFSVMDDPWIPALLVDGRTALMGVREVLSRAGEVRDVTHPSPLTRVAMLRVLLAVTHRVLGGPTTLDAALELALRGFDPVALGAYCDRVAPRFELFGDEPWLQVRGMTSPEKPWSDLTYERGGNNTNPLFNPLTPAEPATYAEAAQRLCEAQTFNLGGLIHVYRTSGKDSPSARHMLAAPRGDTLQETLALCAVTMTPPQARADLPAWERPALTHTSLLAGHAPRAATGPCDVYTWQTRAIELIPDAHGTVACMRYGDGEQIALDPDATRHPDPMVTAVPRQGPKRSELPTPLPLRFVERRHGWRDLTSLLAPARLDHILGGGKKTEPTVTTVYGRPAPIVEHALRLLRVAAGGLHSTLLPRLDISLVGIIADQASLIRVIGESLTVPATAREPEYQGALQGALEIAQRVAGAVRLAEMTYARHVLTAPGADPPKDDVVKKHATRLGCEDAYWDALRVAFDAEVLELGRPGADAAWAQTCQRAAWDVWDAAFAPLALNGRGLRAHARAGGTLGRALARDGTDPGNAPPTPDADASTGAVT